MDFLDKLFPIIVLIIWTLISIKNKQKKGKPKEKPEKNKKPNSVIPLFENLQNSLENLLEANQLSDPLKPQIEDIDEIDIEPKETEIPPESSDDIQDKNKIIESDKKEKVIKIPKKTHSRSRNISVNGNISVHKLREAIVWSEILAKPVSMRNED